MTEFEYPHIGVEQSWWQRRKYKNNCFHHDIGGNPANTNKAVSWIKQELRDMGRHKIFWCVKCGKTWLN